MSPGSGGLPGSWRFVWLFFMQPITLHRLLKSLEVDPRVSLWKLLRRPRSTSENWWLKRLAQVILLGSPGFGIAIALITLAAGFPVSWPLVPILAGLGVVSAVAFGGLGGLSYGTAFGAAVGAGSGTAGAVAIGVAHRMGAGEAAYVVLVAVASALPSAVASDVSFGVVHGGAGGWLAVLGAPLRLLVLAAEIPLQAFARYWNAITGRKTLHWAPVLYHELSYIPHLFLQDHLLAEADADPALARRVLDACSIAPGQRRIGRKVENQLRAREIKALAKQNDFAALQELRGMWLPGMQGADPLLLGFSEAGRYLAAAAAAFSAHHRLKHLRGFDAQINAIENQIRSKRDVFTQPFEEPLRELRDIGRQMRVEAEKAAAGLIPNPFRAGDPLSDEVGPELFRGRETAVRDIEETLSDPSLSASLQLLAPRRAGKTSLLKMLPRMMPDAVCVFFDLQAHPVASVGAFWNKLAEQAIIQAKLERRIDLPKLPEGPPMEAAAVWLGMLDKLPNAQRVLIAIDEFERLEDLFPGSRHEFLQLMGLFRATIQHRRGVRLLASGAAPFDQLHGVWNDHFISVRQIKLPFLDQADSVGLLTQPAPEFPVGAIPEDVAQEVYRQTAGQPFLLQVYGSLLVSRLNEEKRKTATLDDVKEVGVRAVEWAGPFFQDTYKSAPAAVQAMLGNLALGKPVDVTPSARRWLTQRYLVTDDDGLAIPLFAAWIQHQGYIEEPGSAIMNLI